MRRAAVVLVVGLLGCSGDGDETHATSAEEPGARGGPGLPPDGHIEGSYAMTGVAGQPLPATLEQQGDCRVEVLEGALRLEAGRFAYQSHVREVCGGQAGDAVMNAAGGTYEVQDGRVALTADVGAVFTAAQATADSTRITIREVTTGSGSKSVSWTFQRRGGQPVRDEGSMRR